MEDDAYCRALTTGRLALPLASHAPGVAQRLEKNLRLLERDLAHPALAPVASWFAQNIPAEKRHSALEAYALA